MSEYNELYQAVQPESPQVVPDEVRFVYIPKAQKGVAGLAWFNEEHFDVSGDSEVSLSATVLGNIDKKLDKVTESPTGRGRVYAIYGDGREDPQTMWDLDNTGTYSAYHIPSSDGRGYLKVKDPVDGRNPVNKQFLDEKLKGKLNDLGKTSGVFPAAYVRQQGIVAGHDYGKSIEVHSAPDPYTIPVRDAYGALTSASPNSPNNVVTLEYAESHYLKTQPYTTGDGSHSLIFNEIYTNFAFSRDSNVFGENSMVGLWGVKFSAIDTVENSLTVGTISSSPFNVGDRLNIVNDSKYDRSCKFVKYENGKVYVDKLPFSAIVEGDTGFDAYTISSEDNPILGGHYKDGTSNIIDLGRYAFSAGDHNKALNYATFLGGVYNKAYGEYGTAFGRDNEVGYCGFATGRDNACYGQYGTISGGSENKVNASWGFAAGRANNINGRYAGSFGRNNSAGAYGYYFTNDGSGNDILLYSDSACTKPADCQYAVGDTLSAGIGARYINAVTITAISGNKVTTSARLNLSDYAEQQRFIYCEQKNGVGATSVTALQTALGLQNTVLGEKGVGIGAYNVVPSQYGVSLGYDNRAGYSGVSIGTNNKTNKEYCILVGNNNASYVNLTTLVGHGLTSKTTHQSVFGKYNDESSTDPVVFGYGTAEARKNLASIGLNGELKLAGSSVTLNYGASNEETLHLTDVANLNRISGFSSFVGDVWTCNGTFKPAVLTVGSNATVKGKLDVAGDFTVTGTTTVKDVKNLAVEDLTITLGKNLQGLDASLAGLVVPDYNGMQQPGGLVFDDTGTAYVGDVDRTSDGTVYIGNANPIAVRSTASEWFENDIPRWNSEFEGFEPSGFTTDSFVQKSTDSENYYLYARKKGTEAVVPYSTAAGNGRIPMYTVGGVLRVGTAVGDDDAVNLKQMNNALATKADKSDLSNYYPLEVEENYYPRDGETYMYGFSVDSGAFRTPVDRDPYPNSLTITDAFGRLHAMNGLNDDATVDSEYAIDPYILLNVDTVKRSLDMKLDITSAPPYLRHWVADLSKTSDPELAGQVEFWSTGTPNSTTNPTNFSDLFAKRVGKAVIRNISGTSDEYFVYMLGVAGLQGVMYYTAYPFTETNTTSVTYDSVTLSELT